MAMFNVTVLLEWGGYGAILRAGTLIRHLRAALGPSRRRDGAFDDILAWRDVRAQELEAP
jgi:hypothetical protein